MSSVTKIVSKGREQHEELGKSKIYRDSTDLATIQDWLMNASKSSSHYLQGFVTMELSTVTKWSKSGRRFKKI